MILTKTKYILSLLGTILLILSSCSSGSDSNFTIKGKLKNMDAPYFLSVKEITADSLLVDTIRVDTKGEFSYSGKVDTLSVFSFFFGSGSLTPIFVDKDSKIEINGDVDHLEQIEIKGGEINDDLSKFRNDNRKQFEAIHKGNLTDTKNADFEIKAAAREYVKSNPSKIASVVLLDMFFKENVSSETLDELINSLKGVAGRHPIANKLKKHSDKIKQSEVGVAAPDFMLKNLKGKEVRLSDFRGKYVLLMFAQINCPICEANKPLVKEEYEKIKQTKNKIDFITVLLDSDKSLITNEAIEPMGWTLLFDGKSWASEVVDMYNVIEIPYNILISPDGVIVDRNIPITTLKSKLDKLREKKEDE